MNRIDKWYFSNDSYLAVALGWLRLRLECLAEEGRPPLQEPADLARPWRDDLRLLAAAGEMERIEAEAPMAPALAGLARVLGLSKFEREALLLCAAMELDMRTAQLCEQAHGRPYPTFALAFALFDDPDWNVLSPDRPLRYWRLVEISQPAGTALTTSALRIDERLLNALKGLAYLDDRLSPYLTLKSTEGLMLAVSQAAVVDSVIEQLGGERSPIVQCIGTDADSAQTVAGRVAGTLGLPLYRLNVDSLPASPGDLEIFARLWQREALLAPLALYIDAHDPESPAAARGTLFKLLSRLSGFVFVGSREPLAQVPRQTVVAECLKPEPEEQRAAWAGVVGPQSPHLPERLACQFNLNLPAINSIGASAKYTAGKPDAGERLWNACRAQLRPRMDGLAQRIHAKATWDQLILPDSELMLLRQIADQVRHRGRVYEQWGFGERMNRGLGISALFAGESGTGKTMAAEVIANELRLDLYRIDLSNVINKYIGETEKNLRKLFDAAEDGGVILLFDEADALFGKRSEVKDSHDRYANIEVNYLLQRMESYRGLAILATNAKKSLDQAFTRRLRFIVDFPLPGTVERQTMWERVFPADTPVDVLDFERLAAFNLSGAGVHNAALHAAFCAASADSAVTMYHLLDAIRHELTKQGRNVDPREFQWAAPVGSHA